MSAEKTPAHSLKAWPSIRCGLRSLRDSARQVISRVRSVRVIQQEPTVARPAGRKMPQPRLFQQHLLVAESGGGFLVDRVAETAGRVGNAAVWRPHSGRIHIRTECKTRAPAASIQRSPGTLYGASFATARVPSGDNTTRLSVPGGPNVPTLFPCRSSQVSWTVPDAGAVR